MKTTIWILVALAGINVALAQAPPTQPTDGPGSAQAKYLMREASYGSGGTQFWIYTPQPLPEPAPVVILMHGFGATFPFPYSAWIQHLVHRGNIVIYPRYQEDAQELPRYYTPNALAALKAAFGILGSSADLTRVALIGHSLGCVVGFNVVAQMDAGLPTPKALFVAHPGNTIFADLESYRKIPASTLVLVLVGEDDNIVGDATAKDMIAAIPQISRKNFITVQSDNHGDPPLYTSHFAPNAPPVDALDYFGYWKLSDALMNLAFYGTDGGFALGGGDDQTAMGRWSDGIPVKSLLLRPTLATLDIVNAATLQPGPVAPGEMVSLFGAGLGPKEIQSFQIDSNGRLMRSLAGTRVLFGGIASPLVYSFMNRVVAIVPYGIAGRNSVSVQVEAGNYTSAAVSLSVAAAAPGVFSADGSGSGQGSILNDNSTANSPSNPAAKGSQISIFATGEGEIGSPVPEGTLTAGTGAKPKQQVSVTIGGVPAVVTFAGEAPGFFAGMLQVNALLPESLADGNNPVVVTVGNLSSQTGITVAVK